MYSVKSIYFTIQGEGAHTGRPAVFLRFTGCNLWNGREDDRSDALCRFCDTEFRGTDGPGGGDFLTADVLATAVASKWPQETPEASYSRRLVVCTGGEPALQLDASLVESLHAARFEVAIETNGTRLLPPGIDWICVSPKADAELVVQSGDELKLVYPQNGLDPSRYSRLDFRHFSLQPKWGEDREANTRRALGYCLEHPQWSLSIQTHKLLNIP